jgi:hypothetical protein
MLPGFGLGHARRRWRLPGPQFFADRRYSGRRHKDIETPFNGIEQSGAGEVIKACEAGRFNLNIC